MHVRPRLQYHVVAPAQDLGEFFRVIGVRIRIHGAVYHNYPLHVQQTVHIVYELSAGMSGYASEFPGEALQISRLRVFESRGRYHRHIVAGKHYPPAAYTGEGVVARHAQLVSYLLHLYAAVLDYCVRHLVQQRGYLLRGVYAVGKEFRRIHYEARRVVGRLRVRQSDADQAVSFAFEIADTLYDLAHLFPFAQRLKLKIRYLFGRFDE